MSDSMEALSSSLYLDRVAPSWSKVSWPSKRPMSTWLHDLTHRLLQLDEWTQNPMEIPKVMAFWPDYSAVVPDCDLPSDSAEEPA